MIYASAATSGPSLKLLKGCPSSWRRWSMRCPWFWQRCGLKLSGGLRGAADVSNRCATSSIAQQCGCLARLAKFGPPGVRGRCGFPASQRSQGAARQCGSHETSHQSRVLAGMRQSGPIFGQLRFRKTRQPPPALLRTCVRSHIPLVAFTDGWTLRRGPPLAPIASGPFSSAAISQVFLWATTHRAEEARLS